MSLLGKLVGEDVAREFRKDKTQKDIKNMFCSNCGKKIENGAKFCPNCGGRSTEVEKAKNDDSPSNESKSKGYNSVFWKYFWIGLLLNIFSSAIESSGGEGLWIIYFILVGIYVYKFCETINKAMSSIGKNNWWPLGLLSLIPFGFWIAFLIVRAKLNPYGKWGSKHKSFKMSKGL